MARTTLTIDQLRISPLNVRDNQEDANNNGGLESSIAARGVLEELLVHPMRGNAKLWGVFAGGRRYRSVKALVDRGELPRDFAVPVDIQEASDAEIVARSLAENMIRRDLRDYKTFAAIAREVKLGHTPQEVATRHGQTLIWVKRAMRLSELDAEVFAALKAGEISTMQAEAYGATADHELQRAAFRAMRSRVAKEHTPNAIRAWLQIDDRETGRMLRFVGHEAYVAAGGFFEPDLFADGDDARGRVADSALLGKLADGKVADLKALTRERTGRPDLRFLSKPPEGTYGGPDYILSVTPEADGDRLTLPDGDVVASIVIPESGEPDLAFWWANHKAMRDAAKPAPSASSARRARTTAAPAGSVGVGAAVLQGNGYDARQKADAAIKEQEGLTQEGTQIFRSIRRAITRAALIQDAREGRHLGLDYLVWAQLRLALSTAGHYGQAEGTAQVGMKRLAAGDVDSDAARELVDATDAGKTWAITLRELQDQSFLTERDLGAAFLAFVAAPEKVRNLAAAVVAGLAIERSLDAAGYEIPVHDTLAVQARVAHPQGMRHWWAPTAKLLDLLPTAERRAIAEPFLEKQTFASWAKLKSAELTPLVLRVVLGTAPSTRQTMKIAASQWVHPLLAFRPANRTLAETYAERDAAAVELEAAE